MERKEEFLFKGGIIEFVSYLNKNKDVMFPEPIYISKVNPTNEVEVAMQYNDGYSEVIQSGSNGEELVTTKVLRENGKVQTALVTNSGTVVSIKFVQALTLPVFISSPATFISL